MTEFKKYTIKDHSFKDIFNELSESIEFENITKGREGAILVDCLNDLVPIIRTTTKYEKPAQNFLPIHRKIIEEIKKESNCEFLEFNNAMIEIYDSRYRKMGYHTDQSLDLAEDSWIAIFSCYSDPDTKNLRTLKIKQKNSEKEFSEILENNSVLLFSTSTNNKHLHKIVLDDFTEKDTKWLGLTLRLSKTYVKFIDNIPSINSEILTIANETEKKEFYKHKNLENAYIGYDYPEVNYTISISDTLPIN